MDIPNKRDPFFRDQYWADLCIALGERAKNAQNYCSSDKVKPGFYETAMISHLFKSTLNQIIASYSKGDSKDKLSSIYVDLLESIYICDSLMRNKNYNFISHDYPNLFYDDLVIFSLSYVFLKDEVEWKKLSELSRCSHVLVDRLYSLKLNKYTSSEESEFRHSSLFRPLYDIFGAPKEKRKVLLARYLKNWDKKTAAKIRCGEVVRKRVFDNPDDKYYTVRSFKPFVGAWAFEVVPLVLHFDIDDSDFEQYFYYPKDLVAMAREA